MGALLLAPSWRCLDDGPLKGSWAHRPAWLLLQKLRRQHLQYKRLALNVTLVMRELHTSLSSDFARE